MHTKCSVCFTQNSDTLLRNQHLAPNEEIMISVSQFNAQAHFHFHLLPQLCEDTFFHPDPVFFSWSHSWVSPHLDGLDGFKADKMNMGSGWPFMVWLFSLRVFFFFLTKGVLNIHLCCNNYDHYSFFSLSLKIQNVALTI